MPEAAALEFLPGEGRAIRPRCDRVQPFLERDAIRSFLDLEELAAASVALEPEAETANRRIE
jgi:hypothetical protein